jgi:hypothetical protein
MPWKAHFGSALQFSVLCFRATMRLINLPDDTLLASGTDGSKNAATSTGERIKQHAHKMALDLITSLETTG